jgi:hypothetical protein
MNTERTSGKNESTPNHDARSGMALVHVRYMLSHTKN